jgi:D-proline reductase (dithiol) PrdA
MSITQETLQQHLKDPAIFCCRREKGLVISAADLEDPGLFEDMQEAGLLTLTPDGLRIEQVIGCTLLQDVEALTPITKDVLDKVNEVKGEKAEEPAAVEEAAPAPVVQPITGGNGMIHIEIGKAEKFDGLKLDVPVFAGGVPAAPAPAAVPVDEKTGEKTVIRSLIKKHIKISDVKLGDETSIKDGVITINKDIVNDAVKEDVLCKSLELEVIHPDERHIYTETIMDVCPIATKVEGTWRRYHKSS